jgi:tetratricopeptide (TPR) repeat protein
VLTDREIDPGFNAETEMPLLFSQRFLELVQGAKPAARAAYARATVRDELGDRAGTREALQASVVAEPQFTVARLRLAELDEEAGRYDDAIAQYRVILTYSPNQVIALNNLAYALAVHKAAAEEALPLAVRAAALNGNVVTLEDVLRLVERAATRNVNVNVSTVLDTVAWIQHLLGRHAEAARTMGDTIGGALPDNAEIYWHAAVIFSNANENARAALMLQHALKLDPLIADRPEAKALQQRLSTPQPGPPGGQGESIADD